MFHTKNNSSRELNDSDRRIVGVSQSWSGGFPFICYEDDFSELKMVANGRKVEFAYSGDANSSAKQRFDI